MKGSGWLLNDYSIIEKAVIVASTVETQLRPIERTLTHPRHAVSWIETDMAAAAAAVQQMETKQVSFLDLLMRAQLRKEKFVIFWNVGVIKTPLPLRPFLLLKPDLIFKYLSVLLTSLSTTKSYVRQLLICTFLFFVFRIFNFELFEAYATKIFRFQSTLNYFTRLFPLNFKQKCYEISYCYKTKSV